MAENVLILGAGFSCSAGIPLMNSFVEELIELERKRRYPLDDRPFSDADIKLYGNAIKLLNEIDSYHGRANFDDRNIEDLLSILSFKALAGGKGSRSALETLAQAIARTVDLKCAVKGRQLLLRPNSAVSKESTLYRRFWVALFEVFRRTGKLPAIVTFNYDLVLERSLLEVLVGTTYSPYEEGRRVPFDSCRVNYFHQNMRAPVLRSKQANFNSGNARSFERVSGYALDATNDDSAALEINLLKLHGSLNFPRSRREELIDLESVTAEPQILPPIFSKDTAALGSSMWAQALKELSDARNIVVVGYSLPRTDIYMQYFFRAGLGPNAGLSKITVFDPCLYGGREGGDALRGRYRECFSPQLQRRINFSPSAARHGGGDDGTTKHFVDLLEKAPQELLCI